MSTYVHGHSESVLRQHSWRSAENSAAYLLDDLGPGLDLLDVGCGPGTITIGLAERVAPGRVVGVDTSREVLLKASELAAARGVDNVLFEEGDVRALPYADNSFDVVHAHQVLQHLSDPVGALAEMRRVLRPGGLLAVRDADYGAMTWFPGSEGLEAWRTLYQAVARGAGGEPDAGRRLVSWVREAGFSDVEASADTWCYTQEEAAWWSGVWADRVVHSAFARNAIAQEAATETELAELAREWTAWGEQQDAWFVVLHSEVRARKGSR